MSNLQLIFLLYGLLLLFTIYSIGLSRGFTGKLSLFRLLKYILRKDREIFYAYEALVSIFLHRVVTLIIFILLIILGALFYVR